ncbi:MAG: NTPase [Pseudanabaena frigida]|uniref:NTPase n=1 Tax=Pseudanabaena frigida TaxID=945775 RepID=A0A2W4WEJ0_9CYAN|nr:MAG: NTPase [Pseudanabaena frigida]
MNQPQEPINSNIEKYLDYYCGLSSPKFAVMLKGTWGSGKTWFIEQYLEKLEKSTKHKHLYVSLFGMTKFSDIEDTFFQQLHPVMSSKGMEIAGKLFKGLLKASIKFDLDNDGRDDGSVNLQVPDIPDYLKNVGERILIFDDLERCKIDLVDIFGYINQFLEHQGLKIVIIADESKLESKNHDYKSNKEKLVGKTFNIAPDFENALKSFASEVKEPIIEKFLSDHVDFIKDLYINKANRENLRTLRNMVLDLKRIFACFPPKAKDNPEVLKDILKFLILFSTEISSAKIKSGDIVRLVNEYRHLRAKLSLKAIDNSLSSNKSDETHKDDNVKTLKDIVKENYDLYFKFDLDMVFPTKEWWEKFFDKSLIDSEGLTKHILSKYFPDDRDTSNLEKLYYWRKLSDEKFEDLLGKVELEYANKKFDDIQEIKQVISIYLSLSDKKLIKKNKKEVLSSAIDYVNYLNNIGKIPPTKALSVREMAIEKFNDRGFEGSNLPEFVEFSSYIDSIQESIRIKQLADDAKKLLDIMISDASKFYQMVCQNDKIISEYYAVPIFNQINIEDFTSKLFSMIPEDQASIFVILKERYKIINENNKDLLSEIVWLNKLQEYITKESESKQGKPSGYHLKKLNEDYLDSIIEKLEAEEIKYAKPN